MPAMWMAGSNCGCIQFRPVSTGLPFQSVGQDHGDHGTQSRDRTGTEDLLGLPSCRQQHASEHRTDDGADSPDPQRPANARGSYRCWIKSRGKRIDTALRSCDTKSQHKRQRNNKRKRARGKREQRDEYGCQTEFEQQEYLGAVRANHRPLDKASKNTAEAEQRYRHDAGVDRHTGLPNQRGQPADIEIQKQKIHEELNPKKKGSSRAAFCEEMLNRQAAMPFAYRCLSGQVNFLNLWGYSAHDPRNLLRVAATHGQEPHRLRKYQDQKDRQREWQKPANVENRSPAPRGN